MKISKTTSPTPQKRFQHWSSDSLFFSSAHLHCSPPAFHVSHILTLPRANLWQCVSALGWPACWNSLLQHVRSHLDTAREEPREPQCCGVNLPHTHLTRHREVVEHSKKVWKLSENNICSWASQTPQNCHYREGKGLRGKVTSGCCWLSPQQRPSITFQPQRPFPGSPLGLWSSHLLPLHLHKLWQWIRARQPLQGPFHLFLLLPQLWQCFRSFWE